MLGRLLLLGFLIIPLIEIALFIAIGQAIGLWPTLLGIVVIALIGSAIIRHQGLALLGEIRATMGQGRLPTRALADAMLVSIAGVLMVTPGYFTDFLGLLLLVPPIRQAIYAFLLRRVVFIGTPGAPPRPASGPHTIDLGEDHFRPRPD